MQGVGADWPRTANPTTDKHDSQFVVILKVVCNWLAVDFDLWNGCCLWPDPDAGNRGLALANSMRPPLFIQLSLCNRHRHIHRLCHKRLEGLLAQVLKERVVVHLCHEVGQLVVQRLGKRLTNCQLHLVLGKPLWGAVYTKQQEEAAAEEEEEEVVVVWW